MGSRSSKMKKRKTSKDYIHQVKKTERVKRLISGYLRTIESKNKISIPNEIKLLLIEYLKELVIKSKTEIEWEKEMDTQNICLMGPGAVGLTAILKRLLFDEFFTDYDPTIEDAYTHQILVDNKPVKLELLDTAGQDEFKALWTSWIRDKDGFVLVFSLIDRRSFDDLKSWYKQIHQIYEDERVMPSIILVGNKLDLVDTNSNSTHQRVVSMEQAQELATEWNAVDYIETSAKTGENIKELFEILVRAVRENKKLHIVGMHML